MKEKHTAINKKFNTTLPSDVLLDWTEMVSRWEQDRTKQNPYAHTEKGIIYYFPLFRLYTNLL